MKRILLILSLLTGTISLWSQDKIYENSSFGFDSQGKWSVFSEDYNALDRWIASNLKYPQEAINNKEQGTVVVSCVVEKDGSLSSLEIKQGVSPSLDAEALRLGAIMPKWKCAYNYGLPCRTRNQYSVRFVLPKETSVKSKTNSNESLTADNTPKGDKWSNYGDRKVYEGDYELFGRTGKAKYQYLEGTNGSRIFDGHFIFQGENGTNAEGDFKNNHQVGAWVFTNSPIGYVRISFDENNRIVSGTFVHIYDIYGDNIYCQAEGKFMRADDGHLYGPMIYGNKTKRKNRITYIKYINKVTDYLYGEGEYNMDGRETGKWSYGQGKGERYKSIKAEYDNYGNLLESYYIENSTGDKIRWGVSSISDYIRNAINRHWEVISSFFLRDTEEYY